MRAVAIAAARQAELLALLMPHVRERWAVVRARTAPLRTEHKAWLAGTPTPGLEHETAVEVAQPGKLRVGGRVQVFTGSAARGVAYAPDLLKPDGMPPRTPVGPPHSLVGPTLPATHETAKIRPHRWS